MTYSPQQRFLFDLHEAVRVLRVRVVHNILVSSKLADGGLHEGRHVRVHLMRGQQTSEEETKHSDEC